MELRKSSHDSIDQMDNGALRKSPHDTIDQMDDGGGSPLMTVSIRWIMELRKSSHDSIDQMDNGALTSNADAFSSITSFTGELITRWITFLRFENVNDRFG
ncbi:hypothetical protein DPMN_046413 [Dreissena polymorpha]|uniref:Uncharacterized protein n=1 Tax=Dreissena polymorpha TaxID=45954 RepID=A0A9D4D5V3_DREPO|nr:hypothetical protein DPMN_046413 [Dreissena polymorpha]